jgi:hypothetical protein
MGLKKRHGVSPVLAELLIIVVSIVAGVSVGSFGFQVIGNTGNTAVVSASVNSCAANGHNETCSLQLQNTGASNVQTTSVCTLGSATGIINPGQTVPAGGSLDVSCTAPGSSFLQTASVVTGWVVLSNGAYIYFAGS